MKTLSIFLLLHLTFYYLPVSMTAQSRPLKGSNVLLQKSFDFQNFDKIDFRDLDGTIKVNVGSTWSISIKIPDNLFPLLRVEKEDAENQLIVKLENNERNRLYIEDSKISIEISMPEASVIRNFGNQDIEVNGIIGRYFRAELQGNGNIKLQGTVDELEIKHSGNGDVRAGQLTARVAGVKMAGNGNIYVNSLLSLKANGNGNGNVVQLGPGSIHPLSGITGNGEVIKK